MSAPAADQRLGPVGIWSTELRRCDRGLASEAAAELDALGFGAIWIPGGLDDAVLGEVDNLLSATQRATIGTGIINVWKQKAHDVGTWWKHLEGSKQGRVMLGLGVSHAPLIGDTWRKPIAVMEDYLDRLDEESVPRDRMCLAALGPKMLELARDRTAGSHPYLVPPEHSAVARKVLGAGKLLAPEQGVILETSPERARKIGRDAVAFYCTLPNYVNNWRRLGYSEDDVANLSDRLIDALFAWGSIEKIAERVKEHLTAGADHVCVQVITGANMDIGVSRTAWRELAAALL